MRAARSATCHYYSTPSPNFVNRGEINSTMLSEMLERRWAFYSVRFATLEKLCTSRLRFLHFPGKWRIITSYIPRTQSQRLKPKNLLTTFLSAGRRGLPILLPLWNVFQITLCFTGPLGTVRTHLIHSQHCSDKSIAQVVVTNTAWREAKSDSSSKCKRKPKIWK